MSRTASKRYWTSVAEMRGAQVALHPYLAANVYGVVAVAVGIHHGTRIVGISVSTPVILAIFVVATGEGEQRMFFS